MWVEHAAYGAVAYAVGGLPTTVGWAGELADSNGFIYLRARWYDPATGRFIVAEPLAGTAGLPASLNSCAYAYGRPTLLTDALGLDPNADCLQLANELKRYRDELATRGLEIRNDKFNLQWRDPDSVTKHQDQFRGWQKGARSLLERWNSSGCGGSGGASLPADVWLWATMPSPVPIPRPQPQESGAATAVAEAGAVALGIYVVYRIVRFLPSLLPPLWPTIAPNALIP